MKKIAIVTGASSGMGREFIRQIAVNYPFLDEIWAVARRKDRLLKLEQEITYIKIRPFVIDLKQEYGTEFLKQMLRQDLYKVYFLVNCAGFGYAGEYKDQTENDVTGMIKVNCEALTKLTGLAVPYMVGKGRIIQLASAAAFVPQPNFSVYAATKSYVLSFSRSLHKELKKHNIYVTAVCPGPVHTEFFDKAYEKTQVKLYKKMVTAKADKVVCRALKDASKNKQVSVYGAIMVLTRFLCKVFPHSFVMEFIDKI